MGSVKSKSGFEDNKSNNYGDYPPSSNIYHFLVAVDNNDSNNMKKYINDINKENIILELYDREILTSKRLQYILDNCEDDINISSFFIKKLMMDYNFELLDVIFENFKFFDNDFILLLLIYYKNRNQISASELKQLVSNDKYKIWRKKETRHPYYYYYRGNPFLINACRNNNEHIIKYLVNHGANINGFDISEETALSIACKNGNMNIVKYLVEHGVDINGEKKNGDIPLCEACYYNHESIVKYLVEHGADMNKQRSIYVRSPFHYACVRGNESIVRYLVEKGADMNLMFHCSTPLHDACENGHEHIVRYLVENGADVFREAYGGRGETLLYKACSCGNENIVKFLVEHGVNVNRQIENGCTPLHKACAKGYDSIVKYLVEHGADINVKNIKGYTPLDEAHKNGNDNIITYLVEP